jgi:hypothetical protein
MLLGVYLWRANQDTLAEAGELGIMVINTFNFEATSKGTRTAYKNSSDMIASYRKSQYSEKEY